VFKTINAPDGLQIEVVPEIGNATAGSVACCGTKDASLGSTGLGQISSTVIGVKMVDAGGNVVHVTDPQQLRKIRSSYGLLGIVFEVTFKTIPRRKLRYTYPEPFAVTVTESPTIEQVLGNANGFLGFLMPYHGKLVVERRTLDPRPDKSPINFLLDPFKLWIRDRAWEHIGQTAKVPIDRSDWLPNLDATLETFLKGLGSFDTWAGSSMIDFKPTEHAFDFAFWAFPRSAWKAAIPGYLDFCRAFREKTRAGDQPGFRSALPTEVYFMRRDDSALLSVCPALREPPEPPPPDDEDVFTLDLVDIVPRKPEDDAHWQKMNEEFNEFAAGYGARPLLNQTKFLLPDHMKMLNEHWPLKIKERWAEFAKLRKEKDPEGRFLTPYFKNLLEALPG
jgi:hypothetical protein